VAQGILPDHPTRKLVGQRLQATADELRNGAMGTLLTHLVRSQRLGSRERQRLRKLLDEMEGP
jgi:predicted transcriptional regulator